MIHNVLKAYLVKRPEKHLSGVQWGYLFFIIGISIILIVLMFLHFSKIARSILELVIIIAALFVFSHFEKKLNEKWRTDYVDNEKRIDVIRTILLEDMTYKIGNQYSSWYSEQKIDYLIEEGINWIEDQEKRKKGNENFAHIAVLPVIAFLADVIKGSISSDDAIVGCVFILIIIIIGYCIDRFISLIIDLIIKTGSADEMELLIRLLKELKIRDFAE